MYVSRRIWRPRPLEADSAPPFSRARPPNRPPATPPPFLARPVPAQTITELLARDPYLRTLDFAVRAGGLAGALNASSANGLTLFAPDDRAFEALGRNIMDYLVNKDHIKQLDSVLTYHVHNAAVYAGQL